MAWIKRSRDGAVAACGTGRLTAVRVYSPVCQRRGRALACASESVHPSRGLPAVSVWKAEVWPQIKAARDLGAFICFEEGEAGAEAAEGTHLGPAWRPAHR